MNYTSFFSILLSIIISGCVRTNNGCEHDYNFELPIELSSTKAIWSVGDTLTVTLDIDNTMLNDVIGDRTIEYPNFEPLFNVAFVSFDPAINLDSSDIIIDEKYSFSLSNQMNSPLILNVQCDTTDTRSELTFSIALKQKGTFGLIMFSNLTLGTSNIPNRCEPSQGLSLEPADLNTRIRASFTIDDQMVVNVQILTDEHLQLLESKSLSAINGTSFDHTKFFYLVQE